MCEMINIYDLEQTHVMCRCVSEFHLFRTLTKIKLFEELISSLRIAKINLLSESLIFTDVELLHASDHVTSRFEHFKSPINSKVSTISNKVGYKFLGFATDFYSFFHRSLAQAVNFYILLANWKIQL